MSKSVRQGIDFFPLSVEYEERLYAAGRIPGSYFRREGRPAEAAILISRLIDRPMRPLFPDDLRNENAARRVVRKSDEGKPIQKSRNVGRRGEGRKR